MFMSFHVTFLQGVPGRLSFASDCTNACVKRLFRVRLLTLLVNVHSTCSDIAAAYRCVSKASNRMAPNPSISAKTFHPSDNSRRQNSFPGSLVCSKSLTPTDGSIENFRTSTPIRKSWFDGKCDMLRRLPFQTGSKDLCPF